MIDQAKREDAGEVLPLLLSAIGEIAYSLAGTERPDEAADILAEFYAKENNRLSYRHALVFREEGRAVGMLLAYPGDNAAELDRPLAERPGRSGGGIVTEARSGDYYLDSLAVRADCQGRGIAKALIGAFERRGAAAGIERLSLIVEQGNDHAQKLYARLGYREDGELDIHGGRYTRMIKPAGIDR